MSQRSIIEINHDLSHAIDANPGQFVNLLAAALASGDDRSWEPLKRFGITRIVQVHHSADRRVVIGSTEGGWEKDYPFG